MGRYLAVVAVQAEGRRVVLQGAADKPSPEIPPNPPRIPAGNRLVAVVNNGEWQSALDVTFPTSYHSVYRRYREGTWKAMELFFIDEQRAAQIEDGRRVLMSGQPIQDPGRV
jgi:hypothetical protein